MTAPADQRVLVAYRSPERRHLLVEQLLHVHQAQGDQGPESSTLARSKSSRRMISTGPSVRPFLRVLTGRRTISAPFSRGMMSVSQRHQTTGCRSRFNFQLSFATFFASVGAPM